MHGGCCAVDGTTSRTITTTDAGPMATTHGSERATRGRAAWRRSATTLTVESAAPGYDAISLFQRSIHWPMLAARNSSFETITSAAFGMRSPSLPLYCTLAFTEP